MSVSMDSKGPVDGTGGETKPQRITPEPQLEVSVFFTSREQTLKALRKAGDIARPVGASIVVLVAQTVPYPLPLDKPPVRLDCVIRRFEKIARQYPVKTQVRICLCRDPLEMLKSTLSADSLVVVGTRKGWWPTREARLARKLRRAGYEVILEETEP
jgi:hypothetical protein